MFFGTADFAVPALDALVAAGHSPDLVITQPDRPAGRSLRIEPSPVKRRAESVGLRVLTPQKLTPGGEITTALRDVAPELAIVVAYGNLIPSRLLTIPHQGFVNLHPSLLPRYRGASPIQAAIMNGDTETGVTLMQLDTRLDAGPILAQERLSLNGTETGGSLTATLSRLAADLLIRSLEAIRGARLSPRPQDDRTATFTRQFTRDDGQIDWSATNEAVERQVRGLDPWPGTWTLWRGQRLRIIAARTGVGQAGVGQILESRPLRIGCGQGLLEVLTLQFPGGRVMSADQALQGYPLLGTACDAGD